MTERLNDSTSPSCSARAHGRRPRRLVVLAASALALLAGGLVSAPAALASDESAQFSSLASGMAVSGRASSTVTAGNADGYVWAEIDFPTALFSTHTWDGIAPSNCDAYGITLALNGSPIAITYCLASPGDEHGTPIIALYVNSAPMPDPVAGDVITISWGSSYTSTLAPLAGETVYVWYTTADTAIAVTPTLLSAGSGTPIPMWQQAVARASSTSPCPDGFSASWDTWPNGGFVCNRFIPVYGN